MGPGSALITGGNRRNGVPVASSRGRAGMFVLVAAAGLALASGAVTGTSAARAAVAAPSTAVVRAHIEFDPCPCDNPVCRPLCHQSIAAGGLASMVHRQTHQVSRRATTISASAAIICPPPSGDVMSKTGDPGC